MLLLRKKGNEGQGGSGKQESPRERQREIEGKKNYQHCK